MQLVQASDQLLVISHQTQEDTPTDTDDTAEDCTVFERHKCEADDGHKGPELLAGEQKGKEVLHDCQWDTFAHSRNGQHIPSAVLTERSRQTGPSGKRFPQ